MPAQAFYGKTSFYRTFCAMAIPTPDQRIAQPTHDTQISGDRAPGGVCTRPSGSFQHPLARKSENTADKLCRQIYALFDSRSQAMYGRGNVVGIPVLVT